jgi:hypothetical protein
VARAANQALNHAAHQAVRVAANRAVPKANRQAVRAADPAADERAVPAAEMQAERAAEKMNADWLTAKTPRLRLGRQECQGRMRRSQPQRAQMRKEMERERPG